MDAVLSEQIRDAAESVADSARCFSLEGWRLVGPDPVKVAFAEAGASEGFADVVKKSGFERWTYIGDPGYDSVPIGDPGYDSVPISIEVYARAESPEFLVNVVPNNAYADRYVLTDDLPSLMRLLAEWAPAAQGAAMMALVASVPSKWLPVR